MAKIALIAWTRLSRRTWNLARELNAKLMFIPDKPPYFKAWMRTKSLLGEEKYDVVIVQLPQGPLLWRVLQLSKKLGFYIVADVHTGFMIYNSMKEVILNAPFRGLLRDVDLMLSHNYPFTKLLIGKFNVCKERVLTVYDPLPSSQGVMRKPDVGDRLNNYILVPASWAVDEPLYYIVKEFLSSGVRREYQLVITGNPARNRRLASRIESVVRKNRIEDRVILTGYVRDPEYSWLLQHSYAVIAATVREYTMLSAIWEAVSYHKLFLVSRTATLEAEIGNDYPCFFRIKEGDLARVFDKCLLNAMSVMFYIRSLEDKSRKSIAELKARLECFNM